MNTTPVVRLFAVAAVLAASLPSFAATHRTENMRIPFQFSVLGQKMDAGEYRVEREVGQQFATLINLKTGETVRFMLPSSLQKTGRVELKFQTSEQGYKLKMS